MGFAFPTVGNKDDDPQRKVVEREDALKFAEQMGIQVFETSAKDNKNVEEVCTVKKCRRCVWSLFLPQLLGGGVVSLAAVFSVVTQRSSPQTAAHIRTTFLSLSSLCANKITDIRAQETVINSYSRILKCCKCQTIKNRSFFNGGNTKEMVALFVPLQFRKKTKVINYRFGKMFFRFFWWLLIPVWMWMWAAIQRPASCQFVKHAIDDLSSSKRPLFI